MPPFGETREIIEDFARISVKDMRSVFVNQNAVVVVAIVSIARDVRALIAN
jgi:hypothetical protein